MYIDYKGTEFLISKAPNDYDYCIVNTATREVVEVSCSKDLRRVGVLECIEPDRFFNKLLVVGIDEQTERFLDQQIEMYFFKARL